MAEADQERKGIHFRVDKEKYEALDARLHAFSLLIGVPHRMVRQAILSDLVDLLIDGALPVAVIPELKTRASELQSVSEKDYPEALAAFVDVFATALQDSVGGERARRRATPRRLSEEPTPNAWRIT